MFRVNLVDGTTVDCDDFDDSCVYGLVRLQKKKAWRENAKTGWFKTESVHREEFIDFKYVPLARITHIDVIE